MCRFVVYDPHTVSDVLAGIDHVPEANKGRLREILLPLCAVTPHREPLIARDPKPAGPMR
jgi:hypothetical protein